MEQLEFVIFGKEIQKTTKELPAVLSVARLSGKFSFSKRALDEMGNPERVFFLRKGQTWFVMPTDSEEALKIGGKEGSSRKGFTAISFVDAVTPKEHKEMATVEYPIVKAAETYEDNPLFKILIGNGRQTSFKKVTAKP